MEPMMTQAKRLSVASFLALVIISTYLPRPKPNSLKPGVPPAQRAPLNVTISPATLTQSSRKVLDCLLRAGNSPVDKRRIFHTRVIGSPLTYLSVTFAERRGQVSLIRMEESVRVMSAFKRPATILDVGANVGRVAFPVMAIPIAHHVIAVEPVAGNINLLCRTAALNGWAEHPRLTLVQGALSDEDGERTIYVPEGLSDNAAFSAAAASNVKRKLVPEIITIMDGDALLRYLGAKPEVIKIDTQGHEIHVLRGLKKFLTDARDDLVIAEIDLKLMRQSGVHKSDIWNLMVEELGYSVYPTSATVKQVDNVLRVYGVPPLREAQFPPKEVNDLYFIRPSNMAV